MRIVLLANIKRFIQKSSFLFAVFMITQTISVIALEYSFLSFRNQQIEYSTYSSGVASFTISFDETTTLSDILDRTEKIKEIVPSELKQSYITVPNEYETRSYIFGQYQSVLYGDEIKSKNDIIIPHSEYQNKEIRIGDTVEIGDAIYNVVGVRMFEYAEIPIQSIKNKDIVEKLVIETKTIPNNNEVQSITKALQNNFSEYSISAPTERNMLSEYSLDSKTLTTFVLLVLAMINISYIFKVVISKRNSYYAISLCCGATFRRMRVSLIAESLIYGIFAIVIGTVIFKLGLENALFIDNRFSTTDYLFSVLWCIGVIAIPIISSIINFSTKSIKELVYNRC